MGLDDVWRSAMEKQEKTESESEQPYTDESSSVKSAELIDNKTEPKKEQKETEQKSDTEDVCKEEYTEEDVDSKITITIYGMKGEGKTHLAFSMPGRIACLSFDHKSAIVKKIAYASDDRIKVFDAIKYLDESSPETWLETSHKTFVFINNLIDNIPEVDWIVIDGLEILQQLCEMNMRYNNNLMPFQGIANLNIWKERRLYLRQIHRRAQSKAKKGVIYTTYTGKDEIIDEGNFIVKKDVPRWVDAIMYETDIVIKVFVKSTDTGKEFWADVESSKYSAPVRKNVTMRTIKELLPERVII